MGFTRSIWQETATQPAFSKLNQNIKVDVCVVGAGISGLTCAYLLQKKGKLVAIIDKNATVGGTQSQRTTGHLCWALDDRFHELQKLFGDQTKHILDSHVAAIDLIEHIVKEENIECDFRRVPGYLFLDPNNDESILRDELNALRDLGVKDVVLLPKVPLEHFNSGTCLEFPNQAEFHVGKYLSALAQILQERGVKIFTDTCFHEISSKEPLIVTTRSGFNIQAQAIIFATNTPINDRVIMHTKQSAYRTYVIGGKIPKGSFPNILMWDTGDPYHYFRVATVNSQEDILLIGGEDHKTGQEEETRKPFENLESWIVQRIQNFKPVYYWSGQIEEPVDSLAFIGRNPMDNPNIYIATGDSGNGLTHGTIAGILLTDLITGVKNPWEEVYKPSRKNFKAADEYVKENLNVAKEYLKEILPSEHYSDEALANIPIGTGKVLQKGLHKRCVFKDESGKIHECTAICPHLAGEVKWNTAEKTWDCPCHGSRFDPCGKLIDGPAISDLV